ncbi:glycosyltransferase [Sphingobium aquiterrae]|uniref:glycosyltransferase n=1 Tax=Sphingobium aquiterrae TaxID=2038656 RepID=UPI00301AD830
MSFIDLILIALLLICVALVVYPFVLYPVILMLLPRRPPAPAPDAARPSVSMLFCAFNEGAAMPAKIANMDLLKARHPDMQILAFDDGSEDDTATRLAARPDLIELVRGGGRSGKAHGMKLLAARARGDVLVFTDANVTLAPDAIDALLAYYADGQVGGVLGSLHYLGEGDSATASVGSLYWRLEEWLKDGESRSGNVLGADGSIFSVRRALYPDFPDTVLDDLTVSMSVIFAGQRLIKAKDVIAYERLVAARGDEYRRKVRIAARAWHTHGYLRPQICRMALLDRFKYASRKMVRWFGGVFILIGAAAAVALAWRISPWLALGLLGAMLLFGLAAARLRRGPVAAVVDILIAYAATLQGVGRAMRGRTMAVWKPAKSR